MGMDSAKHPWDISEESLQLLLEQSHRPDLLAELVATSRGAFGFFTKTPSYTINYPWLLERLEVLKPGSWVLDVGAGVSPLPLVLAARAINVHSIDGSAIVRTPRETADWNEWGFLDYANYDARIRSWNTRVTEFTPSVLYDRIYSICVIAHMKRNAWEDALVRSQRWLRPAGRLYLAVDLMPSSDFIWNRSEGQQIEPPELHGTTRDLSEILQRLDMRITEFSTLRGVPGSRTDLLFVECVSPYK
jgi:hypothetical protein